MKIPALSYPKKIGILFFAGLTGIEIIWQIYKRTRCKNVKKTINEVILFSEESSLCRVHAISRKACKKTNCSVGNLRRLCGHLESARHSLDVCMYLFNCEDIAAVVTRAFLRGIKVKIIVDASMSDNNACDKRIRAFQEKGIKVRMKKSEYLMHHKFAIVDKELLVTGSVNWTMQGFFGNWENVVVSNQPELVLPFVKEFYRMWTDLTKDED